MDSDLEVGHPSIHETLAEFVEKTRLADSGLSDNPDNLTFPCSACSRRLPRAPISRSRPAKRVRGRSERDTIGERREHSVRPGRVRPCP